MCLTHKNFPSIKQHREVYGPGLLVHKNAHFKEKRGQKKKEKLVRVLKIFRLHNVKCSLIKLNILLWNVATWKWQDNSILIPCLIRYWRGIIMYLVNLRKRKTLNCIQFYIFTHKMADTECLLFTFYKFYYYVFLLTRSVMNELYLCIVVDFRV